MGVWDGKIKKRSYYVKNIEFFSLVLPWLFFIVLFFVSDYPAIFGICLQDTVFSYMISKAKNLAFSARIFFAVIYTDGFSHF